MSPRPLKTPSDDENENDESGSGPACLQCRKRKHKCSRDSPCKACSAAGLSCIYPEFRKRGTKPGFVNNLAQRMEQVESIVLGQTMLLAPHLLSNMEDGDNDNLLSKMTHLRDVLSSKTQRLGNTIDSPPKKKRRIEQVAAVPSPSMIRSASTTENERFLPPPEVLTHLCVVYFQQIHPWIPILHEKRFMPTIHTPSCPLIVLQAITVATIKFSSLSSDEKAYYYKSCRQAVLVSAMDRFSVETLQATIILAFDTIGSGSGPRSWSLVSSASRVVEQLGLAGEEDDMANDRLLNRIGFLNPSRSPHELEGRRRIFWCIFLMDRFCAVTTGWNTSLKSSDVKRRLPLEGSLYRDGSNLRPRYFNISDPEVDPKNEDGLLGGFSYLIEASECLCKTVNFLLHEKTSSLNITQFKNWFDRFQALDKMLVNWKRFLPERWQVARVSSYGDMDENLTVAHITHNTSVLLLHQVLAYPQPELGIGSASRQSIRTCLMAISEISTIMTQFLLHVQSVTSPQMTFCAFVAGRALLRHRFHQGELIESSFNAILSALKEMALRWQAFGDSQDNLASKFARRLEIAKDMNSPIDTRQTVFEDDEFSGPLTTLASPPIADIMNLTAAPSPQFRVDTGNNASKQEMVNNEFEDSNMKFLSEIAVWSDLDYLFTWTDEK